MRHRFKAAFIALGMMGLSACGSAPVDMAVFNAEVESLVEAEDRYGKMFVLLAEHRPQLYLKYRDVAIAAYGQGYSAKDSSFIAGIELRDELQVELQRLARAASDEDVRDIIFGRTAKEILYCKETLRKSKSYQLQEMKHDFDMTKVLNEALHSPSLMNVFQSTNKRANSSSLIPDVKWDDIGGLAHVRSEIMDAIELPLKHPELFTSLRAGLLFFGPPVSAYSMHSLSYLIT